MLAEEGIKFVYYFGSSTMDGRNKAVDAFHNDESIKVMVSKEAHSAGGQCITNSPYRLPRSRPAAWL
jgi:hypothetical protein